MALRKSPKNANYESKPTSLDMDTCLRSNRNITCTWVSHNSILLPQSQSQHTNYTMKMFKTNSTVNCLKYWCFVATQTTIFVFLFVSAKFENKRKTKENIGNRKWINWYGRVCVWWCVYVRVYGNFHLCTFNWKLNAWERDFVV